MAVEVIVVFGSTLRTQLFSESTMYSVPLESRLTPEILWNPALVAGPPLFPPANEPA